MTDSKSFPNLEPPPYLGNSETKTDTTLPAGDVGKDKSLVGVMEPQVEQSVNTSSPVATQQFQSNFPPSVSPQDFLNSQKKGLPKPLIVSLVVLSLIIIIFGFVFFLKPNSGASLVGTKGEVVWWGIENDENIVNPLISDFEKQNSGVKIKYIQQSDKDYRERLTSALASGQGPDLFEIHNSWMPMFKSNLSTLPDNIMKKDDFTKSFYPVVTQDFSTSTGVFAIPLEYDALTLYINEEIFTSALKFPPKTWDDLKQTAKSLTQKSPSNNIIQSGVALGTTDNVDYWPEILGLMMLQNGVNFTKPDTAKIKDTLLYYMHFSTTDKDWDNTMPESTVAFAKNKLAMYFGPGKSASEIVRVNPDIRFRTVELPQLPKDKPTDPNFSYATYWGLGVWKRSKNSEIAWNFAKYMSSPESLQKLNQARKEAGLLEVAYPRPDMAPLQKDDKILGSIVALAPYAESWYLADETNDGQTGINFQMNKIFLDILEIAATGRDLENNLKSLPAKISALVSKFNSAK